MADSITASRGRWDEARERAQFERQLDLHATRVIQADGVDVGFVMCVEREGLLELHTLCIAPEHQGRGLGSQVTASIMARAAVAGQDVVLAVLKTNPRAEALYRRLGFSVVGESEHHRHMRYVGDARVAPGAPSGVTRFLEQFADWAATQPDIHGAALVGSHARWSAGPTSDVDLVILGDDPERFLTDQTWVETFGTPTAVRRGEYGALTSLRVHYRDGLEVEFGFTTAQWTAVPLDPGTRKVISGRMRVLFERRPILSRLVDRG
jgi:GNAT superfamily N-acetyltransferase